MEQLPSGPEIKASETTTIEAPRYEVAIDTPVTKTEKPSDVFEFHRHEMRKLQRRDINHRLWLRTTIAVGMLGMLGIQNYWVFSTVSQAITANNLKDFQTLLGLLTASTLTETYYILKMIVREIFQPIEDYPETINRAHLKPHSLLDRIGQEIGAFRSGIKGSPLATEEINKVPIIDLPQTDHLPVNDGKEKQG